VTLPRSVPYVRPWQPIVDALAPLAAATDATLAGGWVANLATPALIVAPLHREPATRGCAVAWTVALQVIGNVASDDDDVLHALVADSIAALPGGVLVGGTDYVEDTRAGATYRVATTELTITEG
jgi:hypothetical protein